MNTTSPEELPRFPRSSRDGTRRRHSSASFRRRRRHDEHRLGGEGGGEQDPLLGTEDSASPRRRRRRASIVAPQHSSGGTHSVSMRRASAALLQVGTLRGRNSIVDVRRGLELHPLQETLGDTDSSSGLQVLLEEDEREETMMSDAQESVPATAAVSMQKALSQIPAILLVSLLNIMMGIPFGVSYFPIGWSSGTSDSQASGEAEDAVNGAFPLPGKEALGIRMFLFATLVGQLAYTFASKFRNPVALQMVENIPFCHALAFTVIAEQGYGKDALGTLFFLFGVSSLVVGVTFYALGRFKLGRVVYYFPAHVLIGCIGGIGVFITFTSIEVTIDVPFHLNLESLISLVANFNLFGLVVFWEVILRILTWLNRDKPGRPYFTLLAPVYFCLITPLFYAGLWLFDIGQDAARDAGYFFPVVSECTASSVELCDGAPQSLWDIITDEHLFDIWNAIDLGSISWTAVANAIPTMVALAAFSLIHVPINIPAFAVSTNADTDMNAELVAHGYSNFFSGIFGGLQNYLCYSNSVLYAKSGGEGKASSLVIATITAILFVVGPSMAAYIPRCMAGTLLLHLGVDLLLEGIYDSVGKFDVLEYAGIWVITIVMTWKGMSAALIAGVISALLTYAMQSVAHHGPIRKTLTATTLRSSKWNRSPKALSILEDSTTGRNRVFIFQLQGHLFFGNIAQLTDDIKEILGERKDTDDEPWILIIDFTLVAGMDSSAAHAVGKLKGVLNQAFDVPVTLFVTGDPLGFPCEYDLTGELSRPVDCDASNRSTSKRQRSDHGSTASRKASMPFARDPFSMRENLMERGFDRNRVCDSMDDALKFAEDVLIARADPNFLRSEDVAFLRGSQELHDLDSAVRITGLQLSSDTERSIARSTLIDLCPGARTSDVDLLFSKFRREEYKKFDVLWYQGEDSHCAKLLCQGTLVSRLEGTDTIEVVRKGHFIGEVGLVHGLKRLTSVECLSETAIVFTLERTDWEWLVEKHPGVARLFDLLVIRYLTQRCQHVSNRIWETRCVPV